MKLTVEELGDLKPGQKLWYHDHRLGPKEPRLAELMMRVNPTSLLIHVFEDETVVEHFSWSLATNGPTGRFRMTVNPKQWLSKRD
jgi:hypothetical protein